jgi:hypothetical protein
MLIYPYYAKSNNFIFKVVNDKEYLQIFKSCGTIIHHNSNFGVLEKIKKISEEEYGKYLNEAIEQLKKY